MEQAETFYLHTNQRRNIVIDRQFSPAPCIHTQHLPVRPGPLIISHGVRAGGSLLVHQLPGCSSSGNTTTTQTNHRVIPGSMTVGCCLPTSFCCC